MNIDIAALHALEKQESVAMEDLLQAIQNGLREAYRGITKYDGEIDVDIDRTTGDVAVYQIERDEEGNIIGRLNDTPSDFGRAGALAVRDGMRQQILAARVSKRYDEYSELRYTVVSGVVSRDVRANERGVEVVRMGTEADGMDGQILPAEQIPGESLKHGQRVKAFVTDVINNGNRNVQINLSRTHPELVRGLFSLEVPEVADGSVEIVALAREAGHRTKIAVRSTIKGLNAKGACIGPRGQRVAAIMAELNGEKIDIIDWSEDPAALVGNALAPSKVISVSVTDPEAQTAQVVVPDNQLSLAIGREGQNARLAARLTGWKIDIRSEKDRQDRHEPAEGQ
ncbi:transcription termination factor NusA [Corynebacterium anserum]|uniref:Transcription termination/antitermination protein NusA n=1 Tax=Corynebacterium anserum TaxID=2684406 RepID=A0A7G7YNT2_9CORY|nr:transcription termination factor NusA [Corynebacterium anserum]MBC2681744.1 transcription termination/antitermination protein NusA [Corynebacterium anserum]QNH96152.1 transcription termination/antitermination protein NusA [Corynebacterium anserum]